MNSVWNGVVLDKTRRFIWKEKTVKKHVRFHIGLQFVICSIESLIAILI